MIRTWRIDAGRQTLVLAAHGQRLAGVVYWGASLPENEDLETIARAYEIDLTGGMLDANPELSLSPEAGRTFPGQPGLIVGSLDGAPILPKFTFLSNEFSGRILSLRYRDEVHGLTYSARIAADERTHMLSLDASLEAEAPVHLHWLAAPALPAPQLSDELIDFSGRWCGEFQPNIIPWSAGVRYRENRTGRTGHEHFPGLVLPVRGATNTQGEAYAVHYGWSGGHRMVAEELPDGRRQIQFGHASGTELAASTRFETATLFATWSDAGINGCAVAFQRHLRDRIVTFPDPARPRPVHYNCWEAVYFDHNLPDLIDIATRAAALGAERFVLDDGWFCRRDDDTRSLSDWTVDRRKYPDGLTPLINHVHHVGMSFGIWFEPEMINRDSSVYRAHPEWVLGDEDQVLGRHQMALNMALMDVRAFLYERVSEILRDHDIDYVKWDHNRVLPVSDSAQTRGSYALIDRLRTDFPNVEIESCASGGARIDFGILKRTQRVWLSDSNDAIERLRIQHDAAMFLPAAVTGSHVGPRTCHTSGRVIDISMRAWVAAQRHMGFEMDPRELTEHEAAVLRDVTAWWKANRHWTMRADILRLESPDPAVIAEQHLAEDGSRFVAFVGKANTSGQIAPRPIRLTQLNPTAIYRIDLRNRDDIPDLSRGTPAVKGGAVELSGQYLMRQGLTLPWSFPASIWVVEGSKLA